MVARRSSAAASHEETNMNTRSEFYVIDGSFNPKRLTSQSWSQAWSLIIPGQFSGSRYTGLLFYDASKGVGSFYETDGAGHVNLLRSHTTWRKTWARIVPGNFGGTSYTDLLFYDAGAGEGAFFTTDGAGNIARLKNHTTWRKTWAQIVPGNFGGTSYTDLLFYDAGAGEGAFYTTDGAGGIERLKSHTTWRKTWAQIVPGNFGGTSYTGLLFYDAGAGEVAIYTTDGHGELTLLKLSGGLPKTWSRIVPAPLGRTDVAGFLCYDPSAGRISLYAVDHGGNLTLLRQQDGWGAQWSNVVSGRFVDAPDLGFFFYSGTSVIYSLPIQGFYGAAHDSGTVIRTSGDMPVLVGDYIAVSGTTLYDGHWEVIEKFPYQGLMGYHISKPWQGLPPGFTTDTPPNPNPASMSVELGAGLPIQGFYGAVNNSGTIVRTQGDLPVSVNGHVVVKGTTLYDGHWEVIEKFPYQGLMGYHISKSWQGMPPGFTTDTPPSPDPGWISVE
jgi:hypothetical protein